VTGTDEAARRAARVTPSPRQLAWQELEFEGFIHFGPNTFTDREWGDGTESPDVFSPSDLDAAQWVAVCRDAGMRGIILTAKHHDGFCLWPSRHTEHSVRNSPWRDGNGDVVRELADACCRAGMELGIYLSPWDRHDPRYGTDAYNEYYKAQLRELLIGYGDIYCVWMDGACGEGPNGKRQVYDWEAYYEVVRELQPGAVISICGPDVRWCGNEAGHCRESEWSVVPAELQDQERVADKSQQTDDTRFRLLVRSGDEDLGSRDRIAGAPALIWYPAEVNTSIRPGWFYHAAEDGQVKPLDHLLDVYYGSVGGNACFLLNLPPDRRGLIHENDAACLRELGATLRQTFRSDLAREALAAASQSSDAEHGPGRAVDGLEATWWQPPEGTESAWLQLDLGTPRLFDTAMIQEQISVGQRIERFALQVEEGSSWQTIAEATTVGHKRLLRFAPVTAQRVRLTITESRLCPTVTRLGLFRRGGT
jgi:alpha-L-fucosidase